MNRTLISTNIHLTGTTFNTSVRSLGADLTPTHVMEIQEGNIDVTFFVSNVDAAVKLFKATRELMYKMQAAQKPQPEMSDAPDEATGECLNLGAHTWEPHVGFHVCSRCGAER